MYLTSIIIIVQMVEKKNQICNLHESQSVEISETYFPFNSSKFVEPSVVLNFIVFFNLIFLY